MHLTLKQKLTVLIFIPLAISFLIVSLIYNNHINSHFEKMAVQENNHKLTVFRDKVQNLQNALESFSLRISQDSSTVASLNLIVNYEDKHSYKYLVFDQEKRKLLKKFNTFTTNQNNFSVTYYNPQKEIIAHAKVSKDSQEGIIASYDLNAQTIYLDDANEMVTLPPFIQKLEYSKNALYIEDNTFYIQNITPIFRQEEVLGYVKTLIELDQNSFRKLINDPTQNFYLITQNYVFANNDNAPLIDFQTLENYPNGIYSSDEFFYNYKTVCKKHYTQNVYAVTKYSKKELQKQLDTIIYQVSALLVIIFALLLVLMNFFTKKYILNPLYKLLHSIENLKKKKFQSIRIQSNDELGAISQSFNELSHQLQESITEIESKNVLLQNIFNTVPMRLFIKDVNGHYIKANDAFLHDFGLSEESQIIGKTDAQLPWADKEASHYINDDSAVLFENKPIFKQEESQTRFDGSKAAILTSKVALKNNEGNVIGLLGIYEDITEQKAVKKQLQEKEKYLLHQSRLAQMGEMISMIAHQWRQPLAAISSTASSLSLKVMTGAYDEKFFTQRLENINNYSQHLSETIDDFRNFFKKHKEKRKITLEQAVDDSLNIIATSMQNKSIEIFKEYNCFKLFETYPNELRQVILNLLKNAEDVLVESQNKEKWVKITTAYQNKKYVLCIEDNGGGIDEAVLEKIFEPYFSTKQAKDGTGLGLYMSKTIIEDHCKGTLTAFNGKNGAIFKVEL
jgi:PAS domain S-box-containing protein